MLHIRNVFETEVGLQSMIFGRMRLSILFSRVPSVCREWNDIFKTVRLSWTDVVHWNAMHDTLRMNVIDDLLYACMCGMFISDGTLALFVDMLGAAIDSNMHSAFITEDAWKRITYFVVGYIADPTLDTSEVPYTTDAMRRLRISYTFPNSTLRHVPFIIRPLVSSILNMDLMLRDSKTLEALERVATNFCMQPQICDIIVTCLNLANYNMNYIVLPGSRRLRIILTALRVIHIVEPTLVDDVRTEKLLQTVRDIERPACAFGNPVRDQLALMMHSMDATDDRKRFLLSGI